MKIAGNHIELVQDIHQGEQPGLERQGRETDGRDDEKGEYPSGALQEGKVCEEPPEKMKNQKITDMLIELPKKDQERWRKEMRIQEYRQETQQTEERKAKKRKLEDHWEMMRWLV